jgi:L-gulonate 3-dehydrogenase
VGISLFGAILMRRIALVGAGVVGSSWSVVFARAGFEVAVYDADAASAARSAEFVGTALADMAALGLPSAEPAERIAARVKPTARLEDALDGADGCGANVGGRAN